MTRSPVQASPASSSISKRASFNFRKRVAYDDDAKRLFHHHARRQLHLLADALGLAPGSFGLRSNNGGSAVSGEITMHGDTIYVQACQPATRHDSGVLYQLPGSQGLYRRTQRFRVARPSRRSDQLARTIRAACRA